jgi:TetR/AcrR family fatty acid metabolism transcriptional regulator
MTKSDLALERKSQIVNATVACISKLGYHNFSMQDVARHAGVSKGIIHYYFLNKDDLLISVLDKVAFDIEEILSKKMSVIHDSKDQLLSFMDICFSIVRSTKEYYQVNMDFWTQINQKKEVKELISRHYNSFRNTCKSVIDQGIHTGKFKQVDSQIFASFIIGTIDGISLQWLFDDSAFEHAKMVESAKKMILEAICI